MRYHVEGTTLFDGDQAQKGYALNRMCFSFNSAENRKTFIDDEAAYCTKFALTAAERAAVKSRNVLQLIEAGGNVYYLAKLAGILGLNVQDIGAQQTGMSVEAFRENSSRQGGEHGAHHRRHRDDPCPLKAIADGKQNDPCWKPFFSGFDYVHQWLAREQPDNVVVFSNDHGLNFFLDKLPTFAVGAAGEYRNEDEGWGIPVSPSWPGIARRRRA